LTKISACFNLKKGFTPFFWGVMTTSINCIQDDYFPKATKAEFEDEAWVELDKEKIKEGYKLQTSQTITSVAQEVLSWGTLLTYSDYLLFIPNLPLNPVQLKLMGCACQAIVSSLKVNSDMHKLGSKQSIKERTRSLVHIIKHTVFLGGSITGAAQTMLVRPDSWSKQFRYVNILQQGSTVAGFLVKRLV
jgi:hypothetical protein